MPNRWGRKSLGVRSTIHPALQAWADRLLQIHNISLVWGYRGESAQNDMVRRKASKLRYPLSHHNTTDAQGNPCSRAVDLTPYPWSWARYDARDLKHWREVIARNGKRLAQEMGIPIVWGGDWDFGEHGDMPHWQIPRDFEWNGSGS